MKHTTPASEDYLKTIYAHTEWQSEPITPKALATRLGVAPSSVTEMVKKLASAGLITHVPYGPLTLTDAGVLRATAVVRRHRVIETWLVREMGYAWDQVHEEAEVLEHSISDRLLEAINARLGYPVRDPHGDPIPLADGSSPRQEAILLAEAAAGHSGTILRVSDRDPAVLRELAADGIGPGVGVTVLEPLILRFSDGRTRRVTPLAGDAIWVTQDAELPR
ncbi:metal-dependent transcriptional regulator [Cryobacterium psychrophilum]|uniref:Manganese transport regulator n=1 Tax=Cryobacterium psychrophilum TaxID=41988 RepID=A0A4Y8KIN7_9MICO|nr:metal-dependent transcriptional regulator [Cryobacterium psychrophilum]TDW30058.1 DtxR family iron (metal) dependent repressor [Cryobacterium psychrophilum]TFD75497.1 metal-dependent transcriptional regulator [Cryobacterium psychrophilum]